MEQKNKKIILISLVIVLAIVAITFGFLASKKDKAPQKETPQIEQPKKIETPQLQEETQMPKDGTFPLTEEKKKELESIATITGKIKSVEAGSISVKTETEELTLKIPAEGANFISQTTQKDGSFLEKEIGVADLSVNDEVEVQYNNSTNEVMLIVVK